MEPQTLAEELLFTTVRIVTETASERGSGTGFVFLHQSDVEGNAYLVTNKHVVAEAQSGTVVFTAGENARPLVGKPRLLKSDEFGQMWHGHPDPDVDITIMPLFPRVDHMARLGMEVFFRAIPSGSIPDLSGSAHLDAMEEVLFVGYPNGLYDRKHLTPIVRRGITATPYQLDYQGKPNFLIDASVFPGSSGSRQL